MAASRGGLSLIDHEHGLVAGIPVPPTYHGHCLGPLAVRDVITLSPKPQEVGIARAWARVTLNEWGFGAQLIENVTICVSELATNAIQASTVLRLRVPVHVALAHQGRWLLLAVADASPAYPVRLAADGDASGGRGLAIVQQLSTSWGWHPVRWPGMVKVCWAEFSRN